MTEIELLEEISFYVQQVNYKLSLVIIVSGSLLAGFIAWKILKITIFKVLGELERRFLC